MLGSHIVEFAEMNKAMWKKRKEKILKGPGVYGSDGVCEVAWEVDDRNRQVIQHGRSGY